MKPRPETTNKIKDIDFDVVCSPQTIHHVHHLGPSFEIQNWTNKALEHQQKQPCEYYGWHIASHEKRRR